VVVKTVSEVQLFIFHQLKILSCIFEKGEKKDNKHKKLSAIVGLYIAIPRINHASLWLFCMFIIVVFFTLNQKSEVWNTQRYFKMWLH
jgi:hypothetical protein